MMDLKMNEEINTVIPEGRIMYIVDAETGEKVDVLDTATHYKRSKKQDDFLKKQSKEQLQFEEFNSDAGKFIWSYPEQIKQLIQSPEFTKSDLTMIFYLATFVNGLGYLTHGNKLKMKKADLQKVLGIGRNLFNKLYAKLIRNNILIETEYGYKWNEAFNFYGSTAGKAKPSMLVRSYVNQIRELYDAINEDGKRKYSPTALYPIFALVPYLHRTSNIVCKNPDVKDIDEIKYFTLAEIAKLLDLNDSKKMSSNLSGILLDGQTTFRKVESKNEKYLQMNPRIFWRDVVAPDARLIAEFDMIDKNRMNR